MTGSYRRMHFLVEGQTEETIVGDLIAPHFEGCGWHVTLSILVTRRPLAGPASRGGLSSWAKLKRELHLLLRDSGLSVLTTVIDYYGFPADAPGMSTRPHGPALARVAHVEAALHNEIDDARFIPHLVLHETEAWVFAAADHLAVLAGRPALATRLEDDATQAGGPELINDGPSTAPSKRIRAYWPSFSKTSDGPIAISELGLAALRSRCPHMDRWLRQLADG